MHSLLIADASPLIALARVERLNLLPRLFNSILTTEIVWSECLANPTIQERTQLHLALEQEWIEVITAPAQSHRWRLGAGETSTINLALTCKATVLIDDRAARRVAFNLGLTVIGALGVLMLAKRRGLIPSIKSDLDHLVRTGYHLSSSLLSQVLRQANESP